MKSGKIIPLLIIMLLIVPVSYAVNNNYEIPEAVKHVEVEDDGSCVITEEIVYDVYGSINGTYRDIPISGNQSVTNISVETPGYYNTMEVLGDSNKKCVKVWLYKDKDKTEKVSNTKVKVIYKYTFNKGLKVYNDVAELQYMSWGSEWESKVDSLKTFIKIPGSCSECEYWNNPDTYVTGSRWNDNNELETVAENIPERTNFEQRIIMPKSYIKSTENAEVIAVDAKAQIEKDQEKYAQKQSNKKITPLILLGIIGMIMLLPAGVYLLFGREPKTDYNREYEYDLPTKSTPVEVNDIVMGNVGKVDFNAFSAVILDLIGRGYLKIVFANSDNTVLRIAHEEFDEVRDYELDLISYLGRFADTDGNISMADISKKETPTRYHNFMSSWQQKASQSVPESLEKLYFNSRGFKVFKAVSIIMIVLGFAIFLLGLITSLIIAGIGIIIIVEAIMLRKRNTLLGRWTKDGKEYHDKWMNFKKYITDYSLIHERPPASVQVWGKYLVYATTLGCAKQATSTMQKYFDVGGVPEEYIARNNVVFFAYHGGLHQMDSLLRVLNTSDSSAGFGGIGGPGSGGFGGGGGGVF